jgi:hypothetical protein
MFGRTVREAVWPASRTAPRELTWRASSLCCPVDQADQNPVMIAANFGVPMPVASS